MIENVSDTARWVAMYRAMETERPDAHFRDPWARRLAGEKGEAILRAMPQGARMAWAMVVRTAVLDEVILERITAHGVDLVLNLAAGLDTRPWRMELPPALRWVDVDLPAMLDYKTGVMREERPRCDYRALAADLSDAAQRDAVLASAVGEARRVLVVTEGLLVYLDEEGVADLARSLHAQPAVRWWLTDLASPELLQRLQVMWGAQVGQGNAPFRFAPAEGSAFFARFGWGELSWRSTVEEARRLRRQMPIMRVLDLLAPFYSAARREKIRRFSGYLLLERGMRDEG